MDFTEHEELQPLLDTVIPDDSSLPYDMHDVVRILLDEDSVMELQPYYADNIITCFGRLGGHSVGVIANQPFSMGGSLDINASDKAARFIQLCDCLLYTSRWRTWPPSSFSAARSRPGTRHWWTARKTACVCMPSPPEPRP